MIKVITYGTFDLFHEGHYRLLQRAKQLGDYLIVGVTTEEYDQTRGKLNVVDSLITRIENIKKTGLADEIIVEESQGQKFRDIKKYDIDIELLNDIIGEYEYSGILDTGKIKEKIDKPLIEKVNITKSIKEFIENLINKFK